MSGAAIQPMPSQLAIVVEFGYAGAQATAAVSGPPGGLVAERHAIQLVEQAAPVVGQHFAVLDALLGPVLVPARDVVLRLLEVDELVADALAHKHGAVVLVHDALFVLRVQFLVHPLVP